MAVVEELLRGENGGAISFGNHKLEEKAKLVDFEFGGDLWKVKTYKTMTKLEKNGMFVYESVPGTSVNRFTETQDGISFTVEGSGDAQITVGYRMKRNMRCLLIMKVSVRCAQIWEES